MATLPVSLSRLDTRNPAPRLLPRTSRGQCTKADTQQQIPEIVVGSSLHSPSCRGPYPHAPNRLRSWASSTPTRNPGKKTPITGHETTRPERDNVQVNIEVLSYFEHEKITFEIRASQMRYARLVDHRNALSALRTLRLSRGLTQGQLAGRADCPQSLVSLWERGLRVPGVAQYEALARALDVPVLELVLGNPRLGDENLLAELRWYGLDVHGGPDPAWAVRDPECVLADALARGEPRVIDRLPGFLLLRPELRSGLVLAHADARSSARRLGWVTEIARSLVRLGVGAETAVLRDLDLGAHLPSPDAAWDSLEHPASDRSRLPRAWHRWRIDYDRDLRAFEEVTREVLAA